ncbi:MFS transporter [Orbus sturtevantii]|uniref:MFS transporter n=1 Tax=Orbus sturtevantii TaxID=3074109 RepID=UPI00370D00CC
MKDKKYKKKRSNYRWFVAFIFFLAYVAASADRANLGIAMPFIREEFHITNTQAGGLISAFVLFYAIFQLPSAWLLQKFGVRKVIPIALFSTSLVTLGIGLSNSLLQLQLTRVMLGLAESPLPIGVTSTINQWFPSQEKGIATSIFIAAAKFGPVIVPPVCIAIVAIWGWREIFIFFAIPGILLSIVWFMGIPNYPHNTRFVNQQEIDYIEEKISHTVQKGNKILLIEPIPVLDKIIRTHNTALLSSTKEILRSWNIIGCGICFGFQVGITYVLMAWLPTYFLVVKNFSLIDMGVVSSAPWIGAIVGNILGGILSDKLLKGRRKPGMMLSALTTCLMMMLIIFIPGNALYYGFVFFLTGTLLNIGYSNYLAYPMNVANKDRFPFACAIVSMIGQLGGTAAPFITGVILDHWGWDMIFIFLGTISILTFFILFTMAEPLNVTKL